MGRERGENEDESRDEGGGQRATGNLGRGNRGGS